MSDALLEVTDLRKHFPIDKHAYVAAINGISFDVRRGETLGLVGESGSGKSTVGRCVLRLLDPTAGRIVFGGEDITTIPDKKLRSFRRRTQIVFQEHGGALNPRWPVGRIIGEPLALGDRLSEAERTQRVTEMLEFVDLSPRHLDQRPAHLTSSEQQRVGIARALITHPELVVLDEPTSNLDPTGRTEVLGLLKRLQNEFGTAYILISHDLMAVEALSDRVAIMYLGRIVETGRTADILRRQRHPYSKALMSAVLYADPARPPAPFTLRGEISSGVNPRDECSLYGRCPLAEPHCLTAFPPLVEVEPGHSSACYRSDEVVSIAATPPQPRPQMI